MNIICSIAGVQSSVYAYLAEFHSKDTRNWAIFLVTTFQPVGYIFLSLLGWIIIPNDWEWELFGNFILRPWRIVLLSTSVTHLITLILMYSLPQSPMFLMSINREEDALIALKIMYRMNTGLSQEVFFFLYSHLIHLLERSKARVFNFIDICRETV